MAIRIGTHLRPHRDPAGVVQAVGDVISGGALDLHQDPRSVAMVFDDLVRAVDDLCRDDGSAARIETWEVVVDAMQAGFAQFALADRAEGEPVRFRFDHAVRTVPATGRLYFHHPGRWLPAFWLAVVCRDEQRLTQLCGFTPDRLRQGSVNGLEGAVDQFLFRWADTLQTFWLERPGVLQKLTATIEAAGPETATIVPPMLLQKVLYPPIDMFHRLVRRDRPGFTAALVHALHLHKTYWSASDLLPDESSGAIALGPLAIACLAYDAGFPIDVESPYLPKHLLERSWLDEFEI